MKHFQVLVLLATVLASPLFAAQIYGTITENGQPVQNRSVEVVCSQERYFGQTDAYGGYGVYAGETGRCTLILHYSEGQPLQHPVNSYNDPVRYDFEVLRDGNGQPYLRRR